MAIEVTCSQHFLCRNFTVKPQTFRDLPVRTSGHHVGTIFPANREDRLFISVPSLVDADDYPCIRLYNPHSFDIIARKGQLVGRFASTAFVDDSSLTAVPPSASPVCSVVSPLPPQHSPDAVSLRQYPEWDRETFFAQFDFSQSSFKDRYYGEVCDLLWRRCACFSKGDFDVGCFRSCEHEIRLSDETLFTGLPTA